MIIIMMCLLLYAYCYACRSFNMHITICSWSEYAYYYKPSVMHVVLSLLLQFPHVVRVLYFFLSSVLQLFPALCCLVAFFSMFWIKGAQSSERPLAWSQQRSHGASLSRSLWCLLVFGDGNGAALMARGFVIVRWFAIACVRRAICGVAEMRFFWR